MDLDALASQLFNRRRAETQEVMTDATTRTFIGTATADSHDGMVTVTLNGYETPAEDVGETQGYGSIEFPCGPNVKKGDSVVVSAVGGGTLKAPMVVSSSGSGDRQQEEIEEAATTATKYITDITDEGVMVHPDGDETTGWRIADALELLRSGVSTFKVWLENGIAKLRIGEDTGTNMVLDPDGISFFDGLSRFAELAVNAAGMVALSAKNLSSDGYYADFRAYEQDENAHVMAAAGYVGGDGTVHPAFVAAEGGPHTSAVQLAGEHVTVCPDGGTTAIHNADAANLAAMIACRAYVAEDDITIPANGGTTATLGWQGAYAAGTGGLNAASFPDTDYVVSIGKSGSGLVSGFNHVDLMVTSKATGSVTIAAWNDNSYSVTLHVTCIGMDSRYGTIA